MSKIHSPAAKMYRSRAIALRRRCAELRDLAETRRVLIGRYLGRIDGLLSDTDVLAKRYLEARASVAMWAVIALLEAIALIWAVLR